MANIKLIFWTTMVRNILILSAAFTQFEYVSHNYK